MNENSTFILTSPEHSRRSVTEEPVLSSPDQSRENEAERRVPGSSVFDAGTVPASTDQPATCNAERATGSPLSRGGAPSGNRNAQVHGFYSKRATDALRLAIKEHTTLSGFDREVMLAWWQYLVVEANGATQRVSDRALSHLLKLVRIKYGVGRDDPAGIENALQRLPYDLPVTKNWRAFWPRPGVYPRELQRRGARVGPIEQGCCRCSCNRSNTFSAVEYAGRG
jgi:hypothetical protein